MDRHHERCGGMEGNTIEQCLLTEFAQPYIHTDVWSVRCQLSTSSRLTCLKEIFPEDMLLLEVTARDTDEIASPSILLTVYPLAMN